MRLFGVSIVHYNWCDRIVMQAHSSSIGRMRIMLFVVSAFFLAEIHPATSAMAQMHQDLDRSSITLQQPLAPDYQLAITDVGQMRLILSNAGTFGQAFYTRQMPSMEWPSGSGIDHLARGALWIGAVRSTGDTLVTIGARDAYYLDPIFMHTEFTPTQNPEEFSRLPSSPFYRPGTVSDENYHVVLVDTIPLGYTQPPHTPMGISVIQETYSWGTEPADDFVLAEFNVVNIGGSSLTDVWIGIYAELVTNNRNYFLNWPPGGAWFDYQDPQWISSLHLLANHNVRGEDYGATQWAGLQLIGCGGSGPYGRGPDSLGTKQVSLTGWSWSPGNFITRSDASLYRDMSRGETFLPSEFDPYDFDIVPVVLLAVGPFNTLAPGDTAQAVFGFTGGADLDDLRLNASWARRLYDTRYDMNTTPITVKDFTAAVIDGRVRLSWQMNEESLRYIDAVEIQRAMVTEGPFEAISPDPLVPRTSMWYEDFEIESGRSYWYRLILRTKQGDATAAGPLHITASPGSPDTPILHVPMEMLDGSILIRFSIPASQSKVQIGVYDVRGRRIWHSDRGPLAQGEHSVVWDGLNSYGTRVSRGIQVVRLEACGQAVSRKLSIR